MILACEKSLYPPVRHVGRLTFRFAFSPNLGVVHTSAMKEISIRRTRLQSGYRYAGVAQFIAQAMRKRQDESLGRRIHGFSRGYHFTRDRGREKDLSFALTEHLSNYILGQLYGSGAVQFHHVQFSIEIRIYEQPAHANACVDASDIQVSSEGGHLVP